MLFSRRDSILVFLLALGFFCIGLGARPYLTPSEARYIEIPRQMLATGDWLTPRINGVPYFEKPPLFYWMQAAFMSVFGTGEFAGRFMTAILSALTCLVTFATARILYGQRAGWLAAAALATSLLGYGLSRVALVDMPVSLCLTACLACFLAAQYSPSRSVFYYFMYVFSALAVLSKGLIGIVIPGLVIGVWIAATRRWQTLREARLVSGALVFLLIAAPWHVLMERAYPGFLHFYFIFQQFTRYTDSSEFHRAAPWWFFIVITPAGLLPWTGLLFSLPLRGRVRVGADSQGRSHTRPLSSLPIIGERSFLFLLLWIVLPLLFFSVSKSKLVPYIFPIFPPLAMVLGHILAQLWEGALPVRPLRRNCWLIIILFAIIIVGYHFLPLLPGKAGRKLAVLTHLPPRALLPMAVALAALAYALLRRESARALILLLAGFGVTTDLTVNYLAARLDAATLRPLALPLRARLRPDDMAVAYGSYWQDLPVYLNRNVTVAGWRGELNYGVEHYPYTQAWMISTDEFWARCAAAKGAVYVFTHKETLAHMTMPENCRLHVTAEYGKTVLLETQP